MDVREFNKRLESLHARFKSDAANLNSHHADNCTRCVNCVFCDSCDRCYRCSYCTKCEHSTNLTHCISCSSSHHLANSVQCSSCTSSAYLYLSSDLTECNYCFGCVGISRKDFYILNEKYSRSDYFKIVKQLVKTLRLPSP